MATDGALIAAAAGERSLALCTGNADRYQGFSDLEVEVVRPSAILPSNHQCRIGPSRSRRGPSARRHSPPSLIITLGGIRP